jgi:predicted phage tail protein
MNRIYGAGGGGGGKGGGGGSSSSGGGSPDIEQDNLESTQYAQVLDLISEGEIEGLVDGNKSIFLDNTPLQNADNSYNFQNVSIERRTGTQAQSRIKTIDGTSNPIPVNVRVNFGTPITRQITDTDVDAVRITLNFPQLTSIEKDGDQRGAKVKVEFSISYDGGSFNSVLIDTVKGRTLNPYKRDYRFNLNTFTTSAIIEVKRLSEPAADYQADNNLQQYANDFDWQLYEEIKYAKLRYPNSALVGIRIDASQFDSIPTRKYRVRGIKVRIPSNATVDLQGKNQGRLKYTGVWDGTFAAAQWTNDPAWILWDLLTSTRYGFGDHILTESEKANFDGNASKLDKFAFYTASQYCSELVDDGFGDLEPRFSCNVNIQTEEEAYKLINDMCSVFRVMPFWQSGALTISQDAPADAAYAFTLANVTPEGFSYQGGSIKNRPNVAVVSYLDLDLRDTAYEVVEDQEQIEKWGAVRREVTAFACTSRAQANRLGRWILYSERYESEVVSFTTSADAGVVVRPGQIIKIADPVRAGVRRGGRIAAATTTTVTVDDTTDITGLSSGTLNVVMPDGTLEQRTITNISSGVITVSPAFSTAPNVNSVWVLGTSDIQTSTWRVIGIKEEEGLSYTVTALSHNASKYAYVESGDPLIPRDITNLNVIPTTPGGLTKKEVLYEVNGIAKAKALITWSPVTGVNQYRISWREEDGNWTTSTQKSADYEILDVVYGKNYEVRVYSLAGNLLPSKDPAILNFIADGKSEKPETPTGISLIPNSENTAILSWGRALALDVLLGGKVIIKHSTVLSGALWSESSTIVVAAAGNQTQKQVPLLEGTYLIKFEDDTGNQSENAALAVVDLADTQPRLLLLNYREDQPTLAFVDEMGTWDSLGSIDTITKPIFNGTPTNMQYDSGLDGLILTDVSLGSGEYIFDRVIDLGEVYAARLRRRLVIRGYLPSNLWDDRTNLIDTWTKIATDEVDRVDAKLYVRSTADDPNASPTWSAWHEFSNALLQGRGFQFKVVATSEVIGQNILVDELGATFELDQRIEAVGPLTSLTTGSFDVQFEAGFYQPPLIGITSFNTSADTVAEVFNVTKTGFKVQFKQGSQFLANTFNYTAVGYGKEIS